MTTHTEEMISLKEVIKIYRGKGIEVVALTGLDLAVQKGELMAIRGNSGSGKSTLLNLLGGLDQATAGKVMVDGVDMNSLTKRDLSEYRKRTVGFVWQNPARNLVPYLTALQNVELAMMTAGKVDKRFARQLLERMELGASLHSTPTQMSGGQQQRVAVAVALSNRPRILLADEPTGALDTKTASSLLTLLRSLRDELQLTILIVTHDPRIAGAVERTVAIRDGRVAQESLRSEEREIPLEEALAQTRREYVLMDARGRLQLPAEVLEQAHVQGAGRLTAHVENGKIVLSNGQGDE
jgi:ABC-type lipoprotein export system ATPase subunit